MSFYTAVAQHQFDSASGLWSARMQAQYPPADNINGRFAQTQRLTLNSARVVTSTESRATVAVDMTEVIGNPAVTRRWVGTWDLVRTSSGWLLDSPNLSPG